MDSTNTNYIVLSPADLMLMEWLFNHIWPGAAPSQDLPSNPQPSLIHSLPPPSAQLSQPTLHYSTPIMQTSVPGPIQLTQVTSAPPQSSQPTSDFITEPYLTLQVLPAFHDMDNANTHLGHPAQSATARATLLTQPFLGFNALSVSMTGQANQHCMTLAAVTLPRQSCITSHYGVQGSRGGCWGLAISPPFLSCGLSLSDCIYISPDSNGADVQMLHVRVKIYPPVPPTNFRVSYLN